MKTPSCRAALPWLLLLLAAPLSQAAILFNLPGTTEAAGWHQLGTSFAGNTWTAGGFPTAFFLAGNPWPGTVAPNVSGSTASVVFGKSSGGGYFASTSIYNAGTPGTHFITDAAPLAGIQTLVLQIDMGSAFPAAPVLTYNGGLTGPAPRYAATAPGAFVSGFTGTPVPTVVYAWQWDLRGLDPVTDWSVSFTTAPHGTIYGMTLDAGDTFVQAIPEPGIMAMTSLALLGFLRRRR